MADSSLPLSSSSNVGQNNKPVHSYSNRDLSIIPIEFDLELVSKFVKSRSKASGDSHINKGYKYFHEGYIHNITGKFFLNK